MAAALVRFKLFSMLSGNVAAYLFYKSMYICRVCGTLYNGNSVHTADICGAYTACLSEEAPGEKPCFITMSDADIESWQCRKESGSVRVFTAWKGEEMVAYLEITDGGENFATESLGMQNICGGYCMREYRGQEIMRQLLNYVMRTLRMEGYTKLGVDFESINPNVWGFWTKYF